jgi:hypothetical protein
LATGFWAKLEQFHRLKGMGRIDIVRREYFIFIAQGSAMEHGEISVG